MTATIPRLAQLGDMPSALPGPSEDGKSVVWQQSGGAFIYTAPAPAAHAASHPPGGSDPLAGLGPAFVSGWYYTAHSNQTAGTITQSLLTVVPLYVPNACTLIRIGVMGNGNVASTVVRLGIYADGGGYSGALLLDAGTIDASTGFTAGVWKEITISLAVTPGLYWLAGVSQGGAANLYQSSGALGLEPRGYFGLPTSALGNTNPNFFSQSAVAGALPANFSSTIAIVSQAIRVAVKVA